MLGLLARAVAAAGALLAKNPAARKVAVSAAQKSAQVFRRYSRRAVQKCQWWARNRGIRAAYNARKAVLKREIAVMRKSGANKEQIARRAYDFRKQERMLARDQMRKNGDLKSLEKLEQRDAAKYGKRGLGDKDGPSFEGLKSDASAKLRERLGREPSADEINDFIAESATRTDVLTNVLFLTF